jgi:hypothetical protein
MVNAATALTLASVMGIFCQSTLIQLIQSLIVRLNVETVLKDSLKNVMMETKLTAMVVLLIALSKMLGLAHLNLLILAARFKILRFISQSRK